MGWPKDPERLALAKARQSASQAISVEQRLWAGTVKTEDCWLWQGARSKRGYGCMTDKPRNKIWRVHRLSWELANGPIPEDICVLHRCDVPNCVRPEHLFLGTQLENIKDRDKKGRQAKGERCSLSRPEIHYDGTGIPRSEETKRKIRVARARQIILPFSKEHKDKIKAALLKHWEVRRT